MIAWIAAVEAMIFAIYAQVALQRLRQLFPTGLVHTYDSERERDFVLYVVPAVGETP